MTAGRSAESPEAVCPGRAPVSVWIMCLLTIATVLVCACIEILNALAGGCLPLRDEGGNPKWRWSVASEERWMRSEYTPKSVADPETSLGAKWPLPPEDQQLLSRLLVTNAEQFSQQEQETLRGLLAAEAAPAYPQWSILDRLIRLKPLSATERAEMKRSVADGRAFDRLHRAVQTVGLTQYLLAPIAWFFAACMLPGAMERRHRRWVVVCLGLTSVSIALMFYRGYFQSLGW